MASYIFDIETNGLLDVLTEVHSIQLGDPDGTDARVYTDLPGYDGPLSQGLALIRTAEKLIGLNVMGFDYRAVEKLYPGTLRIEQMIDLLVLSRLNDPGKRDHRLRTLGQELGVFKGDYEGSWEVCTPEMMTYARQDIPVTRAIWKSVKHVMDWPCVDTEFRFAYLMALQEDNGFTLDIPAARALEAELQAEVSILAYEARDVFPPIWVRDGTMDKAYFVPKRDDRSKGYTAGAAMTKVKLQEFNPGSRAQVGARLMALGWKPKEFGKDGVPSLSDEILAEMPWPQAHKLVRYFAVSKMLGQLADGKHGWLKVVQADGRVHGRVNSIGCAPGRASHSGPNMAQVSKKDLRMRAVWIARAGWKLVGCDGASIQARALAHYLSRFDNGLAIEREINGDKTKGTDTHSANRTALAPLGLRVPDAWLTEDAQKLAEADRHGPGGNGGPTLDDAVEAALSEKIKKTMSRLREGAKRCLYCVLFGGGDPKLGLTLKEECRDAGVPVPRLPLAELGRLARRRLFAAIVGFGPLEETIKATAKSPKKAPYVKISTGAVVDCKGYLTALGGMRVQTRSEHSALVFLMQGFEQSIMKRAAVIFHFERCVARGWEHGVDFGYCANVHDEVQIEARPEIADDLGREFAECIAEAGRRLKSRCPMAGEYVVGDNWKDTH